MKIVNLYTAVTATTNGAITYQWLTKSRLDTIYASIWVLAGAGGPGVARYEFSLQSSAQSSINDPVGVITNVVGNTTAVSVSSNTQALVTPIGWAWAPVERLYVNATMSNVASAQANFSLICGI